MVKLLFGKDADKFLIASKLKITRERLFAGDWEANYHQFFKEMMQARQSSND